MAALLQGRVHFHLQELKDRNYLLLYTHVLGLLEFLQPHVFAPEYSSSLQLVLTSYFELVKVLQNLGQNEKHWQLWGVGFCQVIGLSSEELRCSVLNCCMQCVPVFVFHRCMVWITSTSRLLSPSSYSFFTTSSHMTASALPRFYISTYHCSSKSCPRTVSIPQ